MTRLALFAASDRCFPPSRQVGFSVSAAALAESPRAACGAKRRRRSASPSNHNMDLAPFIPHLEAWRWSYSALEGANSLHDSPVWGEDDPHLWGAVWASCPVDAAEVSHSGGGGTYILKFAIAGTCVPGVPATRHFRFCPCFISLNIREWRVHHNCTSTYPQYPHTRGRFPPNPPVDDFSQFLPWTISTTPSRGRFPPNPHLTLFAFVPLL